MQEKGRMGDKLPLWRETVGKPCMGGEGGSGNGDIEKGTTDNHVCPFVTHFAINTTDDS